MSAWAPLVCRPPRIVGPAVTPLKSTIRYQHHQTLTGQEGQGTETEQLALQYKGRDVYKRQPYTVQFLKIVNCCLKNLGYSDTRKCHQSGPQYFYFHIPYFLNHQYQFHSHKLLFCFHDVFKQKISIFCQQTHNTSQDLWCGSSQFTHVHRLRSDRSPTCLAGVGVAYF